MVYKCHTVTVGPEICVKMFIFKVGVQSDHLETKCSWVNVSQGKNVTVNISSGSKCHSERNVGGRNVKAVLRQNIRRQNVRRDKTSGDKTSGDKTAGDITSVGQNVRRDKTSVETKRP